MGLRFEALLNSVRSQRGLARYVLRHLRKSRHYEHLEDKQKKKLDKAIEKGDVKAVKKNFKHLLDDIADKEFPNFEKCISHILMIVKRQTATLGEAYKSTNNPELKKLIANEMQKEKSELNRWFAYEQRAAEGELPGVSEGDLADLVHEGIHVSRILRRVANRVRKNEKRLFKTVRKEDNKRSGNEKDNKKLYDKEEKLIKKVSSQDNREASVLQALFWDIAEAEEKEKKKLNIKFNRLLEKLRELKYPEENLRELEQEKEEALKKLKKELHESVKDMNTLYRIIESRDVKGA